MTPGLFAGTSLERPVTCERCEKPLADCRCPRSKEGSILPPSQQKVRIRREKRGGKMVTVVAGLDPHANDLAALLKKWKAAMGTGGTLADGVEIELQGDHREKLLAQLKKEGFDAKPSGG